MHDLVDAYLREQLKNLHTKCTLNVEEIPGSALPWLGNIDGSSFDAAAEAIEVRIHGTALVRGN